ncbi:hypothetical protein ZWY2020_026428 [Hordeum vulgare]|nr:hypothetical protein ZWY2020_026428 [Hordeum vulgare]
MAPLKNLAVLLCVMLASIAFAAQAVFAARGLASANRALSSMNPYTREPPNPPCDPAVAYCSSGPPAH